MPTVNFPIVASYDTRKSLAYASVAKDQRRVNAYYEIARGISVAPVQDAALVKRPGVADVGNTYGSAGQVQYLTCPDPAATWATPASWVFTKDAGNAIKVHSSSTSVTILTSADYVPRFVGLMSISGTVNVILQLQNITSPEGAPSQRVFYSSAIATWTEITDADFTALKLRGQMEFMDGFPFIATGNGRLYQGEVNVLGSWVSTDFLTRGISQDVTQGLMKCRNQLLLAGRETIEVYTNQGNETGSVLERIPFAVHRVGLASTAGADGTLTGKTHYYAALGNFIFFAGRYGGHATSINLIAYDGQNFTKISRTYEDKILSSTEVYSVNKIGFHGKVGIAFQLTPPTTAAQKALVFIPDINDWFEWESSVFSPVNNGNHHLGTTNPQKLYHFSQADNWQDAEVSYDMVTQFRMPRQESKRHIMHSCGIVADTVVGDTVSVQFSDDDGVTWSTARTIDIGVLEKVLRRCGTFRDRLVRITYSGSNELRLHRFYANITKAA